MDTATIDPHDLTPGTRVRFRTAAQAPQTSADPARQLAPGSFGRVTRAYVDHDDSYEYGAPSGRGGWVAEVVWDDARDDGPVWDDDDDARPRPRRPSDDEAARIAVDAADLDIVRPTDTGHAHGPRTATEYAASAALAAALVIVSYARENARTMSAGERIVVVDGQQLAPSTRAVLGAETVWQLPDPHGADAWEAFTGELDALLDGWQGYRRRPGRAPAPVALTWDDGILWLAAGDDDD